MGSVVSSMFHIKVIMKSKFVNSILGVTGFLGLIALLIFAFDISIENTALLILFGLISGIIRSLFVGYHQPSKALFKQRFFIYGFTFVFFITAMLHFVDELEMDFHWSEIIVWLVFGFGYAIYLKWKFKQLGRKTNYTSLEKEELIQNDSAGYETDGKLVKGRLILTNKRLLFKAEISGMPEFEFNLSDLNPNIEIVKILGLPVRILINDGAVRLNIVFPKLWESKIKEQISMA